MKDDGQEQTTVDKQNVSWWFSDRVRIVGLLFFGLVMAPVITAAVTEFFYLALGWWAVGLWGFLVLWYACFSLGDLWTDKPFDLGVGSIGWGFSIVFFEFLLAPVFAAYVADGSWAFVLWLSLSVFHYSRCRRGWLLSRNNRATNDGEEQYGDT